MTGRQSGDALRVRITEYLDIDVLREMWRCHVCDHELISARENYKRGCLVYERDPKEIHPPIFTEGGPWQLTTVDGYGVFVEYYCPGCGTNLETEHLPEGYPPPHDIQVDIDALKAKMRGGEG